MDIAVMTLVHPRAHRFDSGASRGLRFEEVAAPKQQLGQTRPGGADAKVIRPIRGGQVADATASQLDGGRGVPTLEEEARQELHDLVVLVGHMVRSALDESDGQSGLELGHPPVSLFFVGAGFRKVDPSDICRRNLDAPTRGLGGER